MTGNIFFSRSPKIGVRTGREMLSGLLWCVFAESAKMAYRVDSPWIAQNSLRALFRALRGWMDGLSKAQVEECLAMFGSDAGILFIDGSNYGRLSEAIKKQKSSVHIISFFHNVEARFFWDAFRRSKSLHALIVLLCNYLVERKAIANSDVLVFLNARDANLAGRIYRRQMGHSRIEIFPMCLEDYPGSEEIAAAPANRPCRGLFLGGAFYANVQGIKWFAKYVAPFIPCEIIVAGKGFEKYREEIELHGNITVVGTVENVADWYREAAFVISPIFHGSGMKTKTAEAAQFGRPILATSEAFTGFEGYIDLLGIECNTAKEFIDAICAVYDGDQHFDSVRIRSVFDENFSKDAAGFRMRALLNSCVENVTS